jgi:hypothetical protein
MLTLYLLNIPHILVGLSIVYLKDFKDPIQEVSKLDYFYSVSIFQRKTIDHNKSVGTSSINQTEKEEHIFNHIYKMVSDENNRSTVSSDFLFKSKISEQS